MDRRLLIGSVEEELLLLLLWRVELGFCSANDGEGDGVDRWRGEWPGDNNIVDEDRKLLRVISVETTIR